MKNALVVEDKDAKFEDLKAVLQRAKPHLAITRARTVTEADNLVSTGRWAIIFLDVSMDISGASKGAIGGGHANLGGVDVLDTMFYEGIEIPTIVITGFDYFIAAASGQDSEFIGLVELEQMAKERLQQSFLGCVRYGSPDWKAKLEGMLEASSC